MYCLLFVYCQNLEFNVLFKYIRDVVKTIVALSKKLLPLKTIKNILTINTNKCIMKTTLLGLLFLGFTSLSFSQNELAMVQHSNTSSKTLKIEKANATYESVMSEAIVPERIQKLQNVVRNYDIKSNSIYTAESPSTYTVDFKEGKNKVTAIYDHNGQVIESNEMFKDVRLPYAISAKLAKTYPGWEFSKVQCQINYTNQNTDVIYKVVLKMNRQKKTVVLNTSDYLM